MGSRDPRKEPLDGDIYRQFTDPFLDSFGQEIHEFGTIPIHEKIKELAPLGLSKMLHFKPCRETVFIGRMIGGHYGNLCQLKAKVEWRKIIESYLAP